MHPHRSPARSVGRWAENRCEVEPFVEGERLAGPARYRRGRPNRIEAVELLPPGGLAVWVHPVGGALPEPNRAAIANHAVETGGPRIKVVGESGQQMEGNI